MAPQKDGTLYLVATPIGNLEDVTLRALSVLRSVDLILAEDTRHTRKLLSHHDIHTSIRSLHERNERAQLGPLLGRLRSGDDLALVSDAGTPAISDPGYPLVRAAIDAGATVVPVPGPSAVLAALVGSGLPTDRFLFVGYLPRKRGARRRALEELRHEPGTLIFLESPRRLAAALADAAELLGDRPVAVAREVTKVHEEFIRGSLQEVARRLAASQVRGEVTVCVAGSRHPAVAANAAVPVPSPELEERFRALRQQGLQRNDALSRLARESGLPRRAVYEAVIIRKKKTSGPQEVS